MTEVALILVAVGIGRWTTRPGDTVITSVARCLTGCLLFSAFAFNLASGTGTL